MLHSRLHILQFFFLLFILIVFEGCSSSNDVDVLVIGGGASGTTATIQSARLGARTLLVEESSWLGGMLTSAGVSAVDGNYKMPGGLWGEFLDSLITRYGSAEALQTGWVSYVQFEPHVGAEIFANMVKREKNAEVWLNTSLKTIRKIKDGWQVTVLKDGQENNITAKVVIDATELGDVAKACGVKYDIGMDASSTTGESIAPEKANDIVQDLTYVAILKDYGIGADKTIPKPDGYDPSLYYCCCKSKYCSSTNLKGDFGTSEEMMKYGKLPNNKYMINWPTYGNDYYVNLIEMTPALREEALKAAKNNTLGFVYYMQTELGFKSYGLADDEYPTSDKLPFIPYHRESRRIHGMVRFTLNDLAKPFDQPDKLYRTGIAVGDYPVDHHHYSYNGYETLPDLHFYPVPSFSLPMGVMLPQSVKGLIVAEKSISVSNLVNGTTRLQPVVLQIGQASGVIAALATKNNKDIDEISVRDVQQILLEAKGYIMPYLDVPVDDPFFKVLQRIGATGIMKGEGKSVGWENETWFHTEKPAVYSDIVGIEDVYPSIKILQTEDVITFQEALNLIQQIALSDHIKIEEMESKAAEILKQYGIEDCSLQHNISRKEMALLIDQLLDPFHNKSIDIHGKYN